MWMVFFVWFGFFKERKDVWQKRPKESVDRKASPLAVSDFSVTLECII